MDREGESTMLVEGLEHVLYLMVEVLVPIFELIGLAAVAVTMVKAAVGWLSKREISVALDEGLSLSLGFLMAAEILKTILIQDLAGAKLVFAIFGLRALMSLLLHYEMKQERAAEREKEESRANK